MNPNEKEDLFREHRGLVFTIAYDLTGSVADAEDISQEVFLSWHDTDTDIDNPRAYLAMMATHRALDLLRSAHRRREQYPGEWLPEPLPGDGLGDGLGPGSPSTSENSDSTNPEQASERAEAISIAMLVVLQSLTENQRAAFILHDVFDFGYDEVATSLGVTQAAARQLVHRARDQVRQRRHRNAVEPGRHRQAVDLFVSAAHAGDIGALMALLSPDITLISDGGGKVTAARRPVLGSANVMALLIGIISKNADNYSYEIQSLNGADAVVAHLTDGSITTFQFDVDDHGIIHEIFVMRNPDKLGHLSP